MADYRSETCTSLRARLWDVLAHARTSRQPVIITARGTQPLAVLVDYTTWQALTGEPGPTMPGRAKNAPEPAPVSAPTVPDRQNLVPDRPDPAPQASGWQTKPAASGWGNLARATTG